MKLKNPQQSLTNREQQVVEFIIDGLSYKLIAERLEIPIDTVRFHIKNVYLKMHVNNKIGVINKLFNREI